jgi:hypothetical protein
MQPQGRKAGAATSSALPLPGERLRARSFPANADEALIGGLEPDSRLLPGLGREKLCGGRILCWSECGGAQHSARSLACIRRLLIVQPGSIGNLVAAIGRNRWQ